MTICRLNEDSFPFWVLTDDLEAVNQTVNDIFEVLILHDLAMVLTLYVEILGSR